MNATQMINALIAIEHSGKCDPDELRVLRNVRMKLQVSVQHPEPQNIKMAMDHARDVAEMWGHSLPA